jgi:glycosyltransferase involved in cell wall biosynthesis
MNAFPHVAILTPYPFSEYAGGVEVFTEQLAGCLPGSRVFSLSRSGTRRDGWSWDAAGLEHPRRAWSITRRFLEEHRHGAFQLAICNGLYGWPLSLLPPGIPVVQVYHYTVAGLARRGIAEPGVQLRMRVVDGAFDRFASSGKHVVAVSSTVRDEVRQWYHHEARVIPNGVDTTLFTPQDRLACRHELGLPTDARVGLYVGRAEYVKGFDILREVTRRSPRVTFVLVGNCPDLGFNVVVHRHVPHEQMPRFYSAADFLLLPSRYEGFNLTILEALACGLPILVSRAAYPLSEDPRELGAVVDAPDSRAYLAAMEDLPPAAGKAALRTAVAQAYSLEAFRRAWRGYILDLVAGDA